MAELAIVSARRARLRQMADDQVKGARLALQLAEDPTAFLSLIQIGITLNSVLAGAFSGATLAGRLGDWLDSFPAIAPHGAPAGLFLTVAGVTYLNLVIGELVPKRVGLAHAETIALKIAPFMNAVAQLAAPLVWLLRHSTELMLRVLRLDAPRDTTVTEDEIKSMIAEGTESGVFKPAEKDMLEGVLRLADRSVRTIMTPRMDMVWLGFEDANADNVRLIHASGHSRFPVARGDLEEVLGIVHAKDLFHALFEGRDLDLVASARKPLIVPDTTPVLRLLEQFRQSGEHLAIVADEYGSVEGLVSVTDILKAIMGELPDTGQGAEEKSVQRADGSWLIDGMTPIDEVERLVGLRNLREGGGDYATLAGFMIDRLGRIPAAGDRFAHEDARFEVVDMDGRRVDKVLITPPAHGEEDAAGI